MSLVRWNKNNISALFELPFMDLVHQAQTVHRQYFNANEIQLSTLLSIKTGTCPEDCGYCSQSGHYNTGIKKEKLLNLSEVIEKAKIAKANGATRFCMGAAWRSPPDRDFPKVLEMIKEIKSMGLETCVTLGMLSDEQAEQLKSSGLDYYNHNLDTSPEYYEKIITTRCYQDRLDTLQRVREADIKVCCGGIIGLGESREDRVGLLVQLAQMDVPPESVPINHLIATPGTPLENTPALDKLEFVRTIGVARIVLPTSMVRLSAGRQDMSEEMQTLCFLAGANSIHFGEVLLTAGNPAPNQDLELLEKLGMRAMAVPNSNSVEAA